MPEYYRWYGLNRTLCSVLDDMRSCTKSLNFAPLIGLIEEVQIAGNKMEAALSDVADIKEMEGLIKERKKTIIELDTQVEDAKKKAGKSK